MKILMFFKTLFLSLLVTINVQAFDVGGLVGDGEGGYSDVGFGGIDGSGDLGISDADLGGGFGVSDGQDSESGANAGSESSADPYGGGEGGDVLGGSGTDNLGSPSNGTRGMIETFTKNAIDQALPSKSQVHRDFIAQGIIDRNKDFIDHVDGMSHFSPDNFNDLANEIDKEIQGIVDSLSQLTGKITVDKVNMLNYKIDQYSKNLSYHLLESLKKAKMLDPLTRLGLKGVRIVVMEDLPSSLYAKKLDIIYLSRQDIKKYGAVVLYHELMHAGLEKAKKSGAISEENYIQLSELNQTQFGHLDGYVGNARGYYKADGYAYQEALVIGWSYQRLLARMKYLPEGMQPKSEQYLNDIKNNIPIIWLEKDRALRMISSTTKNQNQVYEEFTSHFLKAQSPLRLSILEVQSQVRDELPDLCTPGTVKIKINRYCGSNYENFYATDSWTCSSNYRFNEVTHTPCGQFTPDK